MCRKWNGAYTERAAKRRIERDRAIIARASALTGVPAECITAVEANELTRINWLDVAADLLVWPLRLRPDSSTGPMQIFAHVAVKALGAAIADGALSEADLPCPLPASDGDRGGRLRVWRKLHGDRAFNLLAGACNLRACALEKAETCDFSSLPEDRLSMVFSRYNGFGESADSYGRACVARMKGLPAQSARKAGNHERA